jgi:hypothetical protein
MNQENGKTGTAAPVEMWRVRRANDGYYLSRYNPGSNADVVAMQWRHANAATPKEWPREMALKVANAMIILGFDTGIEIEPV